MRHEDTICAIATAPGEGAVGMLRLSGPGALSLALLASGRRKLPDRRMVAAHLRDPEGGPALDQVLVCHMAAPATYTGEQVVEVYGHGGPLNLRRLLDLFIRLGARLAEPGEFTRRAFVNGRLHLDQAEAVAQIISARNERALDNAQALLSGALGREVQTARQALIRLCALLEAAVDFADDLQGELSDEQVQQELDLARQQVDRLAATHAAGRDLGALRVALVGPANAGKSSLFNQLLGQERALTDQAPGTTRDYLEAEVSWPEVGPVTLVDTAGQRGSGQESALERRGQALAAGALERCQLLILVWDLSMYPGDPLPDAPWDQPLLVAANKQDLCTPDRMEQARGEAASSGVQLLTTSAISAQGVDALRQAAARRLKELLPDGEHVLVTGERQYRALRAAGEALARAQAATDQGLPPELVAEDAREALAHLGRITGEQADEEILDAIFSAFCLGK